MKPFGFLKRRRVVIVGALVLALLATIGIVTWAGLGGKLDPDERACRANLRWVYSLARSAKFTSTHPSNPPFSMEAILEKYEFRRPASNDAVSYVTNPWITVDDVDIRVLPSRVIAFESHIRHSSRLFGTFAYVLCPDGVICTWYGSDEEYQQRIADLMKHPDNGAYDKFFAGQGIQRR